MAPPELLPEGRYKLVSLIAAGGMGEVWRATDQVLQRPVAVKLLRPEYAQDPEASVRFRAEARHAGQLSHPNIAQVFDYSEDAGEGRSYLVMELVDGPSLATLLADGPVGPSYALAVTAQVGAGLAAAHAAGLVHRDIKPANLLISKDGLVKITDFGIAHALGSAPVTRTGEVIGTVAYLAPERATGAEAGPQSDLYALGMVAYECLTGKRPFNGDPLTVVMAHQQQPLPPLPGDVPEPLSALIAELTAKDPEARPPSAALVAARAEQIRADLAGTAPTRPDLPVLAGAIVSTGPQASITAGLNSTSAAGRTGTAGTAGVPGTTGAGTTAAMAANAPAGEADDRTRRVAGLAPPTGGAAGGAPWGGGAAGGGDAGGGALGPGTVEPSGGSRRMRGGLAVAAVIVLAAAAAGVFIALRGQGPARMSSDHSPPAIQHTTSASRATGGPTDLGTAPAVEPTQPSASTTAAPSPTPAPTRIRTTAPATTPAPPPSSHPSSSPPPSPTDSPSGQ